MRGLVPESPDIVPLPEDQGFALILSAAAYQVGRGRLGAKDPTSSFALGQDTWIWQPRDDGTSGLPGWYEPGESGCRVMMHRTSRQHGGGRLPLLWDEAYEEVRSAFRGRFRTLDVGQGAATWAASMLSEALAAYRDVERVVASFRHPYLYVGHRLARGE